MTCLNVSRDVVPKKAVSDALDSYRSSEFEFKISVRVDRTTENHEDFMV